MSVVDKVAWRNFQRSCGVFGLDIIHNHSKRLAGDTYACCWWGRNLTLIECKGKTGARSPHSRAGLQAPAPSFTGIHSSCCLFEISLNLRRFRNHSKWWERSKPVICSLSGLGKKESTLRMSDTPPVGRKEAFHAQSPLTGRNCPQTWNQLAKVIQLRTHAFTHIHTCCTRTHTHSPANSESNFLCTPIVTALFTTGFHQSISISLKSAMSSFFSQPASQLQPACLYDLLSAGKIGACNSLQHQPALQGLPALSHGKSQKL